MIASIVMTMLCGSAALQPMTTLRSASSRTGRVTAALDLAQMTDPIVTAAAVESADATQPSRYLVLMLQRMLSGGQADPIPPSWVVALDLAIGSDGFEAAWKLAGGSDLGMWLNNLGAVSTLAAFSMTDVLLLRCLAILGQVCGIYFCATREPALWNPVAWQSVFLIVNTAQLINLMQERWGSIRLRSRELDVYERVFMPHGITLRQYARLLRCATWRAVSAGQLVAMQGGEASDERTSLRLTVLHSGGLVTKASGTVVDERNETHGFVGDIASMVSGLECLTRADPEGQRSGASADAALAPEGCFVESAYLGGRPHVTVETSARSILLQWDGQQLSAALLEDVELRMRMLAVLTSSLVDKLEAVNKEGGYLEVRSATG